MRRLYYKRQVGGPGRLAVFRAAVLNYKEQIERETLGRRIRNASLKTRNQVRQSATEFDAASADGI